VKCTITYQALVCVLEHRLNTCFASCKYPPWWWSWGTKTCRRV